jgi:hypothetical protein
MSMNVGEGVGCWVGSGDGWWVARTGIGAKGLTGSVTLNGIGELLETPVSVPLPTIVTVLLETTVVFPSSSWPTTVEFPVIAGSEELFVVVGSESVELIRELFTLFPLAPDIVLLEMDDTDSKWDVVVGCNVGCTISSVEFDNDVTTVVFEAVAVSNSMVYDWCRQQFPFLTENSNSLSPSTTC